MCSSVQISTSVPLTSKAMARMSTWGVWPIPSGRAQQRLRLADQPAGVAAVDVVVARDPQEVQTHVVRRPGRDRPERVVPIGRMAAVLPEEMPDERLGAT